MLAHKRSKNQKHKGNQIKYNSKAAKKRIKAKKRREDFVKKRNQQRIQRRSLKKIAWRQGKYLKYLNEFTQNEDLTTLWTRAQRNSLARHLERSISDPRRDRGKRHELQNVLIMVLYALICGHRTYEAIADWLKSKEHDFTVLLGLEHGVPTASTICRIMQKISFEQLHAVFYEWSRRHIPGFRHLMSKKLNLHLCADGKAIRALTKKCEGEQNPPYMLNAYLYNSAAKSGFCIASLPINKKTNEAKALVPFLRQFVPEGSIVTIDAAGAYQETLEAILEAGGQALVCIKGNQSKLEEQIRQQTGLAEQRLKEEKEAIESFYKETGYRQKPSGLFSRHHEGPETGHGRWEERDYLFSNDLTCINRELWPEIKGVGCVERKRMEGKRIKGEEFTIFIPSKVYQPTLHCYLSTTKLEAEVFARLVREHWHIETRLHGILDGPAFNEDRSRMRAGEAMENMAVLRRFAYNLLELLYLDVDFNKRPSFEIRMERINESMLGLEEILYKEKACRPQI